MLYLSRQFCAIIYSMKINQPTSRRKPLIITLAVVLLLVVGLILFLSLNNQNNNQSSNDTPKKPSDSKKKESVTKEEIDETKTLTDEEANASHDDAQTQKGEVAPIPDVSFKSIDINPRSGVVSYKANFSDSLDGAVCNIILSGLDKSPIESTSSVSGGSCQGEIRNGAITAGSDWTITVTYQDNQTKITKKQPFSI